MNSERKFVKLTELRPGPIVHESLPPELLRDIRDVLRASGRYVKPTLEEFELAFMRDQHVEREVLVWKCIAKTWADYKGGEPATDDEAVKCITALSIISMGVTDADKLKLQEQVAAQLVECFNGAWSQRGQQ